MPGHDIIVIGASAGGVEALAQLVRGLPPDLPAAVFVVLHISPDGTSVLPNILNRCGPLPAAHPEDNQAIQHGRIYVAPPNKHLLVKNGHIRLTRGPRENRNRPAVDPLFRTAARWYGPRVVGVVLSGMLDDGTAGLLAIKSRGGTAIVQDPGEAFYAGMPRNAIENVPVDRVLWVFDMAPALVELARQPVFEEGAAPVSEELEIESDIAEFEMATYEQEPKIGTPSAFSCPECHGALWEIRDGELARYRCRTGHAFSPDSLAAAQAEALEEALWTALRALEESAALSRRLRERMAQHGRPRAAARFEDQARTAEERAEVIRQVLLKSDVAGTVEPSDAAVAGTAEDPKSGQSPPPPPGGAAQQGQS